MQNGVQFWPTLVGVETQCVRRDMGGPIGDMQVQVAQVGLTRTEWAVAADVLYDGNIGNLSTLIEQNGANPSFFSEGQVLPSQNYATPADLDNTIQGLLDAACSCFGEQVTLHVPQQYLPHFLQETIVMSCSSLQGTVATSSTGTGFHAFSLLKYTSSSL